ncbi:FitA-like ribbon-helix-helix domain-containing protein [Cyanobium sp. BA20m-14]|uniref:FitA-like ribbon-helix-helix domain-containing protein n=1 Tax=Cyanobium sp. BA20m-14 TaxID=2823703 RepID=UPI0037BF5F4F
MPTSRAIPDLLVRNVDDDLVQAPKKRAGANGRSPIHTLLFLAALTIDELRREVELVCKRGDQPQAQLLEQRAITGPWGNVGEPGECVARLAACQLG